MVQVEQSHKIRNSIRNICCHNSPREPPQLYPAQVNLRSKLDRPGSSQDKVPCPDCSVKNEHAHLANQYLWSDAPMYFGVRRTQGMDDGAVDTGGDGEGDEQGDGSRNGTNKDDESTNDGGKLLSGNGNYDVKPRPTGTKRPASKPRTKTHIPSPSPSPQTASYVSCSGISCQMINAITDHWITSFLTLILVCILCYWRLRICGTNRRQAEQGEYRMVAAQYMENAFDDDFSDTEDGAEYGSDDDGDGGWSNGKKSIRIELNSFGQRQEINDVLTLEEMNG